jgi:VanZ family protein
MAARHHSAASPLALLYAALIVYASLSPFTGWRTWAELPPLGPGYLPWPRYWPLFDVVSNLVGYMPLGALVFGALVRSGWRSGWAALMAVTTGVLLSLTMELLQNLLPQRVPSGLDWALNAGGTVLGLGVAWLVRWRGGLERWQGVRERWFIAHSAGGMALLLAWPMGLLFPTPVPFGLGQVLGRLQELALAAIDGTPWADAVSAWLGIAAEVAPAVPLSRGAEWLTIALGLLAPCWVIFCVVPQLWRRVVVVWVMLGLGLAVTTLSTALNFGPQHAGAWVTSTATPALMAGTLAACLLAVLPRRAAAGLGLVAITALVALVSLAPANPYHAESLLAWEQGRFIRFHGAAQWVGWLWPYTALAYLLGRVVARDGA